MVGVTASVSNRHVCPAQYLGREHLNRRTSKQEFMSKTIRAAPIPHVRPVLDDQVRRQRLGLASSRKVASGPIRGESRLSWSNPQCQGSASHGRRRDAVEVQLSRWRIESTGDLAVAESSDETSKKKSRSTPTRESLAAATVDLVDSADTRWEDLVSPEVAEEVTRRLQRLEVLMLLRRLYRDVSRSERVLRIPIPRVAAKVEGTQELKLRRPNRLRMSDWLQGAAWRQQQQEEEEEDAPESIVVDSAAEVLAFADDVRDLACGLQSDLMLVEDRLPLVFPVGEVGDSAPASEAAVAQVRGAVDALERQLLDLAARIEQSLSPEETAAALREQQQEEQLLRGEDVRARVLRRLEGLSSTGQDVLGRVVGGRIADLTQLDLRRSLADRSLLLEAQRVGSGAVQTLVDLWRRLNGLPAACDLEPLAAGLPRPQPTLEEEEQRKVALVLQVEALDKKLAEASRARESQLRQRNTLLARTRLLATEIRRLDDEVSEVRKELAVRTLQLEMQLIYIALESELLLTSGYQDLRTAEEEALLIAEFGLLDADLAPLRTAVDQQEAILISDDELGMLARDIPDLKQRLGIDDGAPTVPLGRRVQLSVEETQAKLQEGGGFVWRGLRLLGGDVLYSARLFWVAANGTTLKAREVQTLRRTAKDLLVIIPFTIILIAPITPVGHVVVFSFIQKYFPGFYPSAFSTRRQEVMKRYELLKLEMASAATEMDREEAQAKAAAAAAETFEAREEEEGGSGSKGAALFGSLVGSLGSRLSGRQGNKGAGKPPSARVLGNDPKKLRLLQEKLPGISRLLADLRDGEANRQAAAVGAPATPSTNGIPAADPSAVSPNRGLIP